MVRIVSIFIILVSFISSSYGVCIEVEIGNWWQYSGFVERYRNHEVFDDWAQDEKHEAVKGLAWYEDSFLDDELILADEESSVWVQPASQFIPIYTAQVKDISWWAPITIEVEVQGLEDWFEIKFNKKLINSNVGVRILYWQESAYTRNYAEYQGRLIGNETNNTVGSISVAPLVDYSNQFPIQIVGGDKLRLPPSTTTRKIKLCITERPNRDVLIPIHISHLEVDIKIYAGYYW